MNEIAQLFEELGVPKSAAKTLDYMRGIDLSTPLEIQVGTELSQPVVSTAIKYLRERGWIMTNTTKHGKGRPRHDYRLAKPIDDIVDELETGILNRISMLRDNLNIINETLKA